jgi:hypothetical protein
MISRVEIAQAMRGVWLLFMGRPDAVQLFDTSIDGFWESFQAILLVAPIYAFTVAADFLAYAASPDPAAPAIDPGAIFLSRGLTVAIDWITLPILLALLASSLGIRSGYMAYVVVRNWGTVFTLVPYAAVSILELSGMFPGQLILIPAGIAFAISLRVSYMTARRTLGAPVDVAIGFVVLDFLVSLGLAQGIAYVFGVDG